MRFLLCLIFISFFAIKANAQNSRWMYLNESKGSGIFLVDTLSDDIKQLSQFDSHENVVIFWINIYKKVKTKNGSYIKKTLQKIAVDTTNKQYEIKASIEYKGDKMVNSNQTDYESWIDIIPDTIGESLIEFAKSLNNNYLSLTLYFDSNRHFNPYSTKKQH